MKIAIFGLKIIKGDEKIILEIISELSNYGCKIIIFEDFLIKLKKLVSNNINVYNTFKTHLELPKDTKFMFCIGGDGTILEATTYIRASGIPILGINTGRMGFMAKIDQKELKSKLEKILTGSFSIEKRLMLKTEINNKPFGNFNYALNDFTIHKNETSSMINIHTYIDDEFLTTYWADGLIIATPTGSTAYSLSSGGPVLDPESENLILTPIAPHHLTVRPLVIPATKTIKLTVESRTNEFIIALDHRNSKINIETEIKITKSQFYINMINIGDYSFFSALRNKLMWGHDIRN